MKNFFTHIFYYFLITLSCLVFGSIHSYASGLDQETRDKALEIAQLIETNNLIHSEQSSLDLDSLDNLSNEEKFQYLAQKSVDTIGLVTDNDLSVLSKHLLQLAEETNHNRHRQFAKLISEISLFFDPAKIRHNAIELNRIIHPYTKESDWYLEYSAWFFLSLIESYHNKTLSLEYAQNAQLAIPNTISNDITSARINTTRHMAYLYNLLYNPKLALENTESLIDMQREIGLPTDGHSLLLNLIYSFKKWGEYDVAGKLAETLMRIEQNYPSPVPGLTEMRLGGIYVEQGNFQEAEPLISKALNIANIDLIKNELIVLDAIVKAGLGELDSASEIVTSLAANKNTLNSDSTRHVLKAQALIAMSEGRMFEANGHYQKLLDMSVQDILTTNSRDTADLLASLHNSKERQDERERAMKTQAELRETALQRQRWINALLIAILLVTAMLATIAILFARSSAKSAKELAVVADKAQASEKAKSNFLALMSHEFRTPLNGIIGLSDFLSKRAPTEDLRQKTGIILTSGHQLLSLVENILDMTLIENGDITVFKEMTEIRPLFHDIVKLWKPIIEKSDVIFTAHIDESVPEKFETDQRRFSQCVSNILSNAAKFTKNGRVHMHVTAEGTSEACTLNIILADTGCGITEEAKSRLFKPFVQADTSMTRKYGGAGLGLAITSALARMLGGDITVHSREGKGSEFKLSVQGKSEVQMQPLTKLDNDQTEESSPLLPTKSNMRRPGHALVVDDDKSNLQVLQAILDPHGWSFTYVPDGQKALAALNQRAFDIIFMDVRMPNLNGIKTSALIRRSQAPHANIPIIAVTADVAEATRKQCLNVGMDMFLTKPVSSRAVIEAIEQVRYRRLNPVRLKRA